LQLGISPTVCAKGVPYIGDTMQDQTGSKIKREN